MAIVASDGLSLLVGDGEVSENFDVLRGATISRLEIVQQVSDSSAVGGSAWLSAIGVSERRAVIECDALATDEAAAGRLRHLALTGAAGNIQLQVTGEEALAFSAYVTSYRETIRAGEMKRITCRLESSGGVSSL